MKKVLYASFDNLKKIKGATIHIKEFAEALSETFKVTLLTPGEKIYKKHDNIEHITINCKGSSHPQRVLKFRKGILKSLKGKHFDLIHFRSITEGIPLLDMFPASTTPSIFEINGLLSIELPYRYPGLHAKPEIIREIEKEELQTALRTTEIITP